MTDKAKLMIVECTSLIVSTGSLMGIVLCGVVMYRAVFYEPSFLWALVQVYVTWLVVRAICHLAGRVVEWRWSVTGEKH